MIYWDIDIPTTNKYPALVYEGYFAKIPYDLISDPNQLFQVKVSVVGLIFN